MADQEQVKFSRLNNRDTLSTALEAFTASAKDASCALGRLSAGVDGAIDS